VKGSGTLAPTVSSKSRVCYCLQSGKDHVVHHYKHLTGIVLFSGYSDIVTSTSSSSVRIYIQT